MAIIICGTGKSVPKKKVKNTDFPASLETSDEWIYTHTGISERAVAEEHDTSHLLAAEACRNALEAARSGSLSTESSQTVTAADIDLIICATVTPTYKGSPSNACLIQRELSAGRAACFDVTAGCSGFLYGLDTAAALMERHNWRYALVSGSEVLSRIMNWNDRSTCVLFGDGAGAVLLENTGSYSDRGLGASILGADGTRADVLYIDNDFHVQMNGRAVYMFAVTIVKDIIEQLLEKEKITLDDVDLLVCHQANKRILDAAAQRLGCGTSKVVYNIEKYGNTSAASIPITLDDLFRSGQLKKGMTVMLAGFGSGLTWAGCVVRI